MIEIDDEAVKKEVAMILDGNPAGRTLARRICVSLTREFDVDEETNTFNLAVIERLLIALGV